MIKAFGYLRIGGKSQIEHGRFPRQEAAIRAYAKAHDIKIVRIFTESAVSGSKRICNRPAFIALMEALHSNGVKLVLVESLGRLGRDLMVQEIIIQDLRAHGFELLSVAEPDLCGDDPSRMLMRQILGAIHKFEKEMIVVKLRGARLRMKSKAGSCEGRKPFGHYPGESEVLDQIVVLSGVGTTPTEIAKMLNSEGLKTRSGGEWLQPTISKILKRTQRAKTGTSK